MRNKKYTNTTFTKRVDHEGGEHRAGRSPAEPVICEKCGAVYADRRWTLKGSAEKSKHEGWHPPNLEVCPACKQIDADVVGGYVSLDGNFLAEHREEIRSMLKNEERRAKEDNPLSRIMSYTDTPEGIQVKTTTEHLAQRFGHALESAFKGEVRYSFSHENKVARVTWHRD